MGVEVHEGRVRPYFQVDKPDMAAIRKRCSGRELGYAIAVYTTICEQANSQRSDSAALTYSELARLAGLSVRKLQDVRALLVEAGVLEVESGLSSGSPNVWTLVSAEGGLAHGANGVGTPRQGGWHAMPTPTSISSKKGKKKEGDDQTALDVPEARVEAFVAWHREKVESKLGSAPSVTASTRSAAREILRRVNGDTTAIKAMWDFAQRHQYWAPKVTTLAKWKQHYTDLRAAQLADVEQAHSRPQRRDEAFDVPKARSVTYD